MSNQPLTVDPMRLGLAEIGIPVRVYTDDRFRAIDIMHLDRASLLVLLRSSDREWGERLVLEMLGHAQ